jgi:hypothetical protein
MTGGLDCLTNDGTIYFSNAIHRWTLCSSDSETFQKFGEIFCRNIIVSTMAQTARRMQWAILRGQKMAISLGSQTHLGSSTLNNFHKTK